MKSAKEWASEVVSECDGALVLHHLGGGRSVAVDVDVDASELDDVIDDARCVIERLVERVQADAIASCSCRSPRLLNLFGTTVGVEAAEPAEPRRGGRGARRRLR